MRFRTGDRCGEHTIKAFRGTTPAAEVYEAIDGRDGSLCVLKVVVNATARPSAKDRLKREARAIASIDHAHVLRFRDAGFDGDALWLLCSWYEGTTLRDRMRGGPPPPAPFLRWMKQACDGVAEAHRHKILHRDLKPENILVTRDGELVKVADFEIAKFVGAGLKPTEEQLLGTGAYMAPERFEPQPVDGRVDVYSLCVILYEGLSGENPMGDHTTPLIDSCWRQKNLHPPALATFVPHVPDLVSDVVQAGLEKEPRYRLATVRELGDAVQRGLEELLADEPRRAHALTIPMTVVPAATAEPRPLEGAAPEQTQRSPILPAPVPEPAAPCPSTRPAPLSTVKMPVSHIPAADPTAAAHTRSRTSTTPEHGPSLGPATFSAPDLGRSPLSRRRLAAWIGLPVAAVAIAAAGAVYLHFASAEDPPPATASTPGASILAPRPPPSSSGAASAKPAAPASAATSASSTTPARTRGRPGKSAAPAGR